MERIKIQISDPTLVDELRFFLECSGFTVEPEGPDALEASAWVLPGASKRWADGNISLDQVNERYLDSALRKCLDVWTTTRPEARAWLVDVSPG